MSLSDDDFGDDDEDFLALTLKPARPAQSTQRPQIPPHASSSSSSQRAGVRVTSSQSQDPQRADLLAAKGEVAVLRAKIDELEQHRRQERESLLRDSNNDKADKLSKIQALEAMVKRLEDEKKFLSVEIRNLSANKRRKRQSAGDKDQFRRPDDESQTPTPDPVTPAQTLPQPAPQPQPQQAPPPPRRITTSGPTVRITNPSKFNENAILIDTIMHHTIPGLTTPTMTLLSRISLPCAISTSSTTISAFEPLSTYILQSLVRHREALRLDQFITRMLFSFKDIIMELFILERKHARFPVPFILALMHCIIGFRPKAVTKDTLKEMVELCKDLLRLSEELLKPDEEGGETYQRHKRLGIAAVHEEILERLVLVYVCDLLEELVMCAGLDREMLKEIVGVLNKNDEFVKWTRLAVGTSSDILVIYPCVEVLSCCLKSFEEKEEKYPLMNHEIVSALVNIVLEGIDWKPNWLFSGLNRLMGNTVDNVLVEGLVGDKLSHLPCAIHPIRLENKFKVENSHQHTLLLVQLNIICLLEKVLITTTEGISPFNKDAILLRNLVFAIGKQQELIFNNPRNNLTHIRSKLISSIVRCLHAIWDISTIDSESTSPVLTKDTSHELLIVLGRIAYSNNDTSDEAGAFLMQAREKGEKIPVFNYWAEKRARLASHITDSSNDIDIIQAQMAFSNGLEFAYDDDVVELARDILERCTTMDEADMLYISMTSNVERTRQDEDEDLMMMDS